LAGASGIHTGTAGVGKMQGSPEEDITAAENILKLFADGHFFEQSWTRVSENDEDLLNLIHQEEKHPIILEKKIGEELKNVSDNFRRIESYFVETIY
jgi:ribulose-bisphosphate carboxylase large chain